jgi:hypothetical protein
MEISEEREDTRQRRIDPNAWFRIADSPIFSFLRKSAQMESSE